MSTVVLADTYFCGHTVDSTTYSKILEALADVPDDDLKRNAMNSFIFRLGPCNKCRAMQDEKEKLCDLITDFMVRDGYSEFDQRGGSR